MSPETIAALVLAHLNAEGLTLCEPDGLCIDGERQAYVLRELGVLVLEAAAAAPSMTEPRANSIEISLDDLRVVDEWGDDKTTEIRADHVGKLRELSRRLS